MTTFGPFQSYSPCSGPIDDAYSNCVDAYENEIAELKKTIIKMQNQIKNNENRNQELEKYADDQRNANIKLNEEIAHLESVNHQIDRQIKAIQQINSKYVNRETQTDQDDLIAVREQNIFLKEQINNLLSMSNKSLGIQSVLIKKSQNKKANILSMKNKNAQLFKELQDSILKEEELYNQISEGNMQKISIKAENKRLILRLTETEGNLEQSDYINSRLRTKLEQANEKQKQINGQEMLEMSSQIVEQEAFLRDLELQLKDIEKSRKELIDAQKELTEKKEQYQLLAQKIKDIDRQNSNIEN